MTEAPPRWVHAAAWGGLAVLSAALVVVWLQYAHVDVWSGWTAADELARPIYAERVHARSVLRTRMNTWSNLAFVLVGLYALALAAHDRGAPAQGYVRRTPALSALFGAACVYLGAGSGLFHASLTRLGQQLDVAAMYAPLLALLSISAGRALPRVGARPSWPLLVALTLAASALLFAFKWQMSSAVALPSLILAVIAARLGEHARGSHPATRWLAVGAGCMVVAVTCRQLDVAGRFTGPDHWLQGHALWHLLCAGALGAAYADQRAR